MTIDHPIRRALARVCSADTMSRIVDPVLADIASEQRRARWLGYFDLLKALAVHATTSAPGIIARAAVDDRYAMPRAAGIAMAVAFVAAALSIALTQLLLVRRGGGYSLSGVFVLPGAFAWMLPAALLIAIPRSLRGHLPTARTRRHVVALGVAYIALSLVLIGWVVPEANQVYRVQTSGNSNLSRGLNELGLVALDRQIDALKSGPASAGSVRRAQIGYHQRLALIATPLPLSIIALAIAASRAGRRWPLLAGTAAFTVYVLLVPPIYEALSVEMNRFTSWPTLLLAWLPQLLLGLLALACYRSAIATPPNAWTTLPPPGSWNDRIS